MTVRKWRLDRTAAYGAACGVLQFLVRSFSDDPELTSNVPRMIGNLVGSVIGGVFLFLIVAAIRNSFVGRHSN
jgi:hypothetical protein